MRNGAQAGTSVVGGSGTLRRLWDLQAKQQHDLGIDPRCLNELDRRIASGDLILNLHEEVSELGRVIARYKRHILASAPIALDNVGEEIADILKLTFTVAQLHGMTMEQVVEAFVRKTLVVTSRAEGERLQLQTNTRIICTDLDDVVCDLSPWHSELDRLRGNAPANARTLQMMEAWRDDWYQSGKFKDMEAVPGAAETLGELSQSGFKIIIITARPQWQYKRIHADTLEWLDLHGVPHDLILFGKDKLELLYAHVAPAWPTAFIEDHERNVRHLSAAGVRVLLFDTPRNQGVEALEGVTRVIGWDGVRKAMEECL